MENKDKIYVYTDGACEPNPGVGGYGCVIISGNDREELYGGFEHTTNNRMELYSAIVALSTISPSSEIVLTSDSQYLVNMFNKDWIKKWKKKNWMKTKYDPVKNLDLVIQLYDLYNKHNIIFQWVRGHDGHIENEICDQLASDGICCDLKKIDEEYLKTLDND